MDFVRRDIQRVKIEDEARWLARYLGSNQKNFESALLAIKADPPPIGAAFMIKWESTEVDLDGRLVIAFRKQKLRGRTIVIFDDLAMKWTENFEPESP